eukprot:Skav218560  [mRNA]  locus=scaffold1408:63434:84130:- [translate_table: standard]
MRLSVLAHQLEMTLTEEELAAEPYSQGHLFDDELSESERSSRLRQLNAIDRILPGGLKGYLQRARSLLKDAQAGTNPFAGLTPEATADGANLSGTNGPGSETFAEMERLGMQQLSGCAFCLVAGGLGERLGFPGIKLYCSFILACQRYARKETGKSDLLLPFAIMTSGDTHQHTVELMAKNVAQPQLGLASGILCATLGVSAKNSYVMNSVAIPRICGESIGGICRLLDSKGGPSVTLNVEYNQLDPLLKETPAGGDVPDSSGFSPFPGNINILLFSLVRYAELLDETGGVVPEFVNPKWGNAEKSKLKSSTLRLQESLMQDFPRLCKAEDKVGMTQFDRWIAKTSVKNNLEDLDAKKKVPPECALSAEADIYACNARLLQLAGDVTIAEADEVTFLGIKAFLGPQHLGPWR